MTATVADFILARVEADEAQARRLRGQRFRTARVLAQCAAIRAVVELARDYSPELSEGDNGEWAFDATLRALATIWRDDPDFDEGWAL